MQSADVTETHEEKEDVEEVKCGWNERSCSWAHSDVFVSSQSSTGWDQQIDPPGRISSCCQLERALESYARLNKKGPASTEALSLLVR
jgi:hypothetical protein